MPMNAAIQYHDDSFRTDQPRLMGRQAATEGFFRAWLRHGGIDVAVGHVERVADRTAFIDMIRRIDGHDRRLIALATPGDTTMVQATGTLFRPDPRLANLAFRRRRGDPRRWSLVGITHTTASVAAMAALSDLLIGPLEPWDALICTSSSVQAMVKRQIDGTFTYFRERLGAAHRPKLNLPVIPLGVDAEALDPGTDAAQAARQRLREQLGIAEKDVVVLYFGRLSAYVKAHPLPMLLGLEEAVRSIGRRLDGRVHLIQAGWFSDDAQKAAWEEAQRVLAPSIVHHVVDGRVPDVRSQVRFAADLFASFADNIQETFGLTVAEAMAAGLPVVAADWDGYRETLDDSCGILVSTTVPQPTAGQWLARRFEDGLESYDTYCAAAALATAVDVSAARDAFVALLTDPTKRRAMGAAGRERAKIRYEWATIVACYQSLFADLQKIRKRGPVSPRPTVVNPWRRNPFVLFDGYASRTMRPGMRVRASVRDVAADDLMALEIVQLRHRIPCDTPNSRALLDRIAAAGAEGAAYNDLLAAEALETAEVFRLNLGWLMKIGLVEIVA